MNRLGQLVRSLEAEVRRHRRSRLVRGPAAVLAARRREKRREPDVVAAAPVAADRAERGEAGMPAVRPDADAVDARAATTATPQPRSVPARRTANVSLPTTSCPAQPRRSTAARSASSSAGKSTPAIRSCATSATGRHVEPASATAACEQPSEHVHRPLEAEAMRRALRPAHVRQDLPVGADEREVGLGVAAVDGEHQ